MVQSTSPRKREKFRKAGITIFFFWQLSTTLVFASLYLVQLNTYSIDPSELDFSEFKVSFWGQPSRGLNYLAYNTTGDAELEMFGEANLSTTFYRPGLEPYLANPAQHAELQNITELFGNYSITVTLHPACTGFPDDFNSPQWLSSIEAMVPVIDSLNLSPTIKGFVLDMERTTRHNDEKRAYKANSSLPGVLADAHFELLAASRTFHNLVVQNVSRVMDAVHNTLGNEFEMVLVCQNPGLYDLADRDADIQMFEQYPTFPPQWDANSWMFYHMGTEPPRLHYRTYHLVRQQVSLLGPDDSRPLFGHAGEGYYNGTNGLRTMAREMAICRYLGIKEVIWYNYARFWAAYGLQGLIDLNYLIHENQSAIGSFSFSTHLDYTLDIFTQFIVDHLLNITMPWGFIIFIGGNVLLTAFIKYYKKIPIFKKIK